MFVQRKMAQKDAIGANDGRKLYDAMVRQQQSLPGGEFKIKRLNEEVGKRFHRKSSFTIFVVKSSH